MQAARTASVRASAGGAPRARRSVLSRQARAEAHVIEEVEVPRGNTLGDYESSAMLVQKVRELASEASAIVPRLSGTVHMINSTARGGGVAEMLPREVSLLQQL